MTTTLSEGVKVPDVGSVNWAGDLEVNWNLLNGALANLSGNVKTDRDNIWTGEQSFTLPIVGSITGTASKAIADEDGTSIKTGYVSVAGNQTVSGQKTWSGNQFFTGNLYAENTSYTLGTTPSDNVVLGNYYLTAATHTYIGLLRTVVYSNGRTGTEIRARNKFKNGALDTTGTDVTANLNLEIQQDGAKTLYFDGSIRNNVLPYATNTYSLGSSSYQWSSVYAQTYYYNGTQWGLDKANEWTETNIFSKRSDPASVTSIADTTLAFNGLFNTIFLNTRGSSNRRSYGSFLFVGYGSASGADNYGQIQLLRSTDKRGDTNEGYIPDTSFKLLRVNPHSLLIDFMENVRVVNDETDNYLAPITTNVTDLGTSTNKWKTLNGVNPGALSLPGLSNAVSLDTTEWNVTGSSNGYTPTMNGWLCISIKDTATSSIYIYKSSGYSASAYGNGSQGQAGRLAIMLPVIANQTYNIIIKADALSEIYYAKFLPCLGNV